MKIIKKFVLIGVMCFIFSLSIKAQDKNIEKMYGSVSLEDFNQVDNPLANNSSALILFDVGTSRYELFNGFKIYYSRHKRILVKDKNGYEATFFKIPIFSKGTTRERLDNFKAHTFINENGKITKISVSKDNIFEEKISNELTIMKVNFPNLQPGCIVEYTYEINSNFILDIEPWVFQSDIPNLYSSYTLKFLLNYKISSTYIGQLAIDKKEKDEKVFYTYNDQQNEITEKNITWQARNIAKYEAEPYTFSAENLKARIVFQVIGFQFDNNPTIYFQKTWEQIPKIIKENNLLGNYEAKNKWLEPIIKDIIGNTKDSLEIVKKIYLFIRDNFTSSGLNFNISKDIDLKQIFESKNGTSSEINLLLAALLIKAGFTTYPVILSTQENGQIINTFYPLLNHYNHLIVFTTLTENNKEMLLDASLPYNPFDKIPIYCYNGQLTLIKTPPIHFELKPNQIISKSSINVTLLPDSANQFLGQVIETFSDNKAQRIREMINKNTSQDYKKIIQERRLPENTEITELNFLNLLETDKPLIAKFKFLLPKAENDEIVFYPTLGFEAENVFKIQEKRIHPVEFSSLFQHEYKLNMNLPENYEIIDNPKSEKLTFNNGEIDFVYLLKKYEGNIQLIFKLNLNESKFNKDDYDNIKQFFEIINKKINEPIIFKINN